MPFSTADIAEHIAEVTHPRHYGAVGFEPWQYQCQETLERKRYRGRVSYARWIAKVENQTHKRAYMKEYESRPERRAKQVAKKRAARAEYRKAHPLPVRVKLPKLPSRARAGYAKAPTVWDAGDYGKAR